MLKIIKTGFSSFYFNLRKKFAFFIYYGLVEEKFCSHFKEESMTRRQFRKARAALQVDRSGLEGVIKVVPEGKKPGWIQPDPVDGVHLPRIPFYPDDIAEFEDLGKIHKEREVVFGVKEGKKVVRKKAKGKKNIILPRVKAEISKVY